MSYLCLYEINFKKINTLRWKSCKVDMKTKEHGTLEVLENSAQYDGGLIDDAKSLMF